MAEYYFAYGYCYCFLELHFYHRTINKRIKNIYIDMELVLPMYNAHPYFPSKTLAKKCALHTAKYGTLATDHCISESV